MDDGDKEKPVPVAGYSCKHFTMTAGPFGLVPGSVKCMYGCVMQPIPSTFNSNTSTVSTTFTYIYPPMDNTTGAA